MHTRRSLAMLVLAVLMTAAPLPAAGSCAAPSLAVVAGGGYLEVRGADFADPDHCQDACDCSGVGGCARCDCGPPPVPVVRAEVQLVDASGGVLAERQVAVRDGAFVVALPAHPAGVRVEAVGRTAVGGEVGAQSLLPATG